MPDHGPHDFRLSRNHQPALAAIALVFFPARTDAQRQRIRSFATGATALIAAFGVFMWYGFRDQSGVYAYEETRRWLPALGSSYHLGVDGISMPLLLLSAVLFVFAVLVVEVTVQGRLTVAGTQRGISSRQRGMSSRQRGRKRGDSSVNAGVCRVDHGILRCAANCEKGTEFREFAWLRLRSRDGLRENRFET